MTQAPLLIWDFDGVICDSLTECVTVTQVASRQLLHPELVVSGSNLHEICHPEHIAALYAQMQPLRPFIVKGQDYLWQYFNLPRFRATPAEFAAYQRIFDSLFAAEQDRIYEQAFYSARKLVQQLMQDQYFSLFTAYSGTLFAFRAALHRNRNYICTARDKAAVLLLFRNNGIDFSPEKIFSKDFNGMVANAGNSKSEQILAILDQEGGRNQAFLLIEDQVKAPQELSSLCPLMKVIHAAWGYGLDSDWRNAGLACARTVKDPEYLFHNIY